MSDEERKPVPDEELDQAELDAVAGGINTVEGADLSGATTTLTPLGTDGSSVLRARSEVSLSGIGDRFDGTYYVDGVTHQMGDDD